MVASHKRRLLSSFFWKAWTRTFTEKLVQKAFSATGIFPPDANVILDKFVTTTPEKATTPPHQTALTAVIGEPPWLKAKTLLRAAMVKNDEAARRADAVHPPPFSAEPAA